MIFRKGFSNFQDSSCNIFRLTLVHIIYAVVYNHKRCCVLQRNILCSPYDIFNTIFTDTQVKGIFKIAPPNMLVSCQTCCNRVTNYNDWCSRILQKFFLERKCFPPPKFVYPWHRQTAAFSVVIASKAPGVFSRGFCLCFI